MPVLVRLLSASVLFTVCQPTGHVLPQALHESTDRLESYVYREGFHAGSLRSEVPLPIYDPDPAHLWNRLFAAFYVRRTKPASQGDWLLVQLLPPDETVPTELSPALLELWRRTYNNDTARRIEGGDILDPPLLPRPDAILADNYFKPAFEILDEFILQNGQDMLRDPLRRALLQRDLWPVFDLLQQIIGYPNQVPDQETRRQALSQRIAAVMRAVALTKEEVASLPDTYLLAIQSGRFAHEHEFDISLDYLPDKLLERSGDWVELDRSGNRRVGLFHHEGDMGFVGRSWFRVFCRFPLSAGGRMAVEQLLSKPLPRDQDGYLSQPDVPPGMEVALLRVMLTIDRDGMIQPTKLAESVQLRVIRYGDGELHPDTNSGRGQNFYEYEMSRSALFAGMTDGGLRRVSNTAPQYFFGSWPFSTVSSFSSSRWTYESFPGPVPLHRACSICHRHDNTPVHTPRNTLQPWPEKYPFGLGSIRSLLASLPAPLGDQDSEKLADTVINWKKAHRSFQRLHEYWLELDR